MLAGVDENRRGYECIPIHLERKIRSHCGWLWFCLCRQSIFCDLLLSSELLVRLLVCVEHDVSPIINVSLFS
jgi:hypothetical protein